MNNKTTQAFQRLKIHSKEETYLSKIKHLYRISLNHFTLPDSQVKLSLSQQTKYLQLIVNHCNNRVQLISRLLMMNLSKNWRNNLLT